MAIIKFSKKHKLKEDRFIESLFELRQKVEVLKKPLMIAGFSILFVALVTLVIFKMRGKTNEEANTLFGSAMMEYQQGQYSNAITKFKQVSDGYSGSTSAPKAVFLIASLYYDLGNYQLAIETYKKYIDKYSGSDFLSPAAYKGLGASFMQLKDYKQAVDAFTKAINKFSTDYQIPEIRCKLGRCYLELKEAEKAKKEFEKVVETSPKSPFAQEAALLLASL